MRWERYGGHWEKVVKMGFLGFGKKGDKPAAAKPASAPAAPAPAPAKAQAQAAPLPQTVAPAAPQPRAAASAPATDGAEWRTPALTTYKASELGISDTQLETAFADARKEADKGAPFGGVLWHNLIGISNNPQYVDLLVDELPNEAFGHPPGAHFTVMLRCWVRATSDTEWATYKQLAMYAGWRPGDVNALQLYETFAGPPDFLSKARHPIGLNLLPETMTLSPHETAVFGFMQNKLAEFNAARQASKTVN